MNRSILKSKYSRQICSSASETKVSIVDVGIFKNDNEELSMCIRETRSEPFPQNKAHYKSIVSW